ncbi:hypothetical protein L598_000200000510 [Mesorhizobium sp. J18]|uniref:hypothetical protein n=1 Tax=Mesorhizobium sp. J18 TaxID=935263 RepID=UPI00119C833E|nr:hypothetical protein [Mesorhizobium sp. J18]TWG97912.1 hypothetical protein L598_000200000510 [Mesorhizobium sp. J18]
MSDLLACLGRFFMIVFGFLAAILSASLFINLLVISAFRFDAEQLPDALAGGLYVGVPLLAVFVGYLAFWPAAAVIVALEIFARRDWLFHALGGGVVGLVVSGYFWLEPQENAFSDAALILALIAAGMVGGIAYWMVAGRSAGRWLQRSPTSEE